MLERQPLRDGGIQQGRNRSLSGIDFLQIYEWRIRGLIERHNEIIKEAISPEYSGNRELITESGFDSDEVCSYIDANTVEEDFGGLTCYDAPKAALYPVLNLDPEPPADGCMKVAVRRSRIYVCLESRSIGVLGLVI